MNKFITKLSTIVARFLTKNWFAHHHIWNFKATLQLLRTVMCPLDSSLITYLHNFNTKPLCSFNNSRGGLRKSHMLENLLIFNFRQRKGQYSLPSPSYKLVTKEYFATKIWHSIHWIQQHFHVSRIHFYCEVYFLK